MQMAGMNFQTGSSIETIISR
ncbi:hypothetical protein [uncultured Robinsoniella sp.]